MITHVRDGYNCFELLADTGNSWLTVRLAGHFCRNLKKGCCPCTARRMHRFVSTFFPVKRLDMRVLGECSSHCFWRRNSLGANADLTSVAQLTIANTPSTNRMASARGSPSSRRSMTKPSSNAARSCWLLPPSCSGARVCSMHSRVGPGSARNRVGVNFVRPQGSSTASRRNWPDCARREIEATTLPCFADLNQGERMNHD